MSTTPELSEATNDKGSAATIRIYNTLSREKENFEPVVGEVPRQAGHRKGFRSPGQKQVGLHQSRITGEGIVVNRAFKVFDFIARVTPTGGKDRGFLSQLLAGGMGNAGSIFRR